MTGLKGWRTGLATSGLVLLALVALACSSESPFPDSLPAADGAGVVDSGGGSRPAATLPKPICPAGRPSY